MMVLVIVGMIVGLLSGMFGIGGGTVIVPVLVWLGLSQRHAAATSMLAIVPTSISGVISYAHNGNVDWVAAALLSNAQSCYARAELEMTGLAGVLDDVIISSEEKIRKPARDLYMLALDREFVTAKHALMVGNDEQNDIVGVRTAGDGDLGIAHAVTDEQDDVLGFAVADGSNALCAAVLSQFRNGLAVQVVGGGFVSERRCRECAEHCD